MMAVLLILVGMEGAFAPGLLSQKTQILSGFDSLNVKFVGNWPFGPSYAVSYDAERNLVFLGSGGGVYILDVSDPSNPSKVSEKIYTRGIVEGLFYTSSDKRLYIADGQGGLEIWDVQDPVNPFKLGHYFTPGTVYGVYVSGNYAYVADGYAGLQIYLNLLNIEEKDKIKLTFSALSFRNSLFLNIPSGSLINLEIFDISGRNLKNLKGFFDKGNHEIKLNLKNGIYFYKIKSEFGNKEGKIIVF